MHLCSSFLSRLRMMLVGIWLGLHWVLFSFFDHYIQTSDQFSTLWCRGPHYNDTIPAAARCGPHAIILFVRGTSHTRGNIWKFSVEGLQSCGPCGAAGHPWPAPCPAPLVPGVPTKPRASVVWCRGGGCPNQTRLNSSTKKFKPHSI